MTPAESIDALTREVFDAPTVTETPSQTLCDCGHQEDLHLWVCGVAGCAHAPAVTETDGGLPRERRAHRWTAVKQAPRLSDLRDAICFANEHAHIGDDERYCAAGRAMAYRIREALIDQYLVARAVTETTDLRAALAAYEADPVNLEDRPESWRRLDDLLSAVRAALAEEET